MSFKNFFHVEDQDHPPVFQHRDGGDGSLCCSPGRWPAASSMADQENRMMRSTPATRKPCKLPLYSETIR